MNFEIDPCDVEPLFSRPYIAEEIPANGVTGLIEASEGERDQIAAALDLAALESFSMKFQLSRAKPHHFKLSGRIVASAIQTCVVSLKPVRTKLDDEIDVEFWPPEDVARIETDLESGSIPVPLEGPEPILDGIVDVGHLAYEHLASSLDLYPKAAGEQFEWNSPDAQQEDVPSDRPFAELGRLSKLLD